MILRSATMDDDALLLAWRNDPLTRQTSISSDPVDAAQHQIWLADVLADPARSLLVAISHDEPVGTVRIDREGEVSELSWTVSPDHRGKGHGTEIVGLAVAQTGGAVKALIKESNEASRKIATAAGLSLTGSQGGIETWTKGPA